MEEVYKELDMEYKITIVKRTGNHEQKVYEQIVEILNLAKVVEAVNSVSK